MAKRILEVGRCSVAVVDHSQVYPGPFRAEMFRHSPLASSPSNLDLLPDGERSAAMDAVHRLLANVSPEDAAVERVGVARWRADIALQRRRLCRALAAADPADFRVVRSSEEVTVTRSLGYPDDDPMPVSVAEIRTLYAVALRSVDFPSAKYGSALAVEVADSHGAATDERVFERFRATLPQELAKAEAAVAQAAEAAAGGAGVDLSPRLFPAQWTAAYLAACRAEAARWTA